MNQEPTLGSLPGFMPRCEIIEADAHVALTKGACVALDPVSSTTITPGGVSTTFVTPGGDTSAVATSDRYFAIAMDDVAAGARGRFVFKGRVLAQVTATTTAGMELSIQSTELFLTADVGGAANKVVAMAVDVAVFTATGDLCTVLFDGEGLPLQLISAEL